MDNKLTAPARVVLALKRRTVKKRVKRTPSQRLKSRLYYRRNKIKLKLKRKRYLKRNNIFSKSKKLFKRSTPSWLNKTKSKAPKLHKPKFKKFKFNVPKRNK
jgi:hypothetical protein